LLTWLEGAANPVMAMEARLWGARGSTVWWDLASVVRSETAGMLELGRLPSREALLDELLNRVTATLPAPGAPGEIRAQRGAPLLASGPVMYRSPALPPGGTRVMVLPFANATTDKRASWLATELTGRAMELSGRFRVVEPAQLRAALIEQGLRSFLELGPSELRALGRRVGTSFFVQGTVYSFREVSPFNERIVPHVELQLSLIDAESYRVLWTTQHGQAGDAYEGAFEQGRITNAVALLEQVLAEIVEEEGARARTAKPPDSTPRGTP
jgi:TolB-like protein